MEFWPKEINRFVEEFPSSFSALEVIALSFERFHAESWKEFYVLNNTLPSWVFSLNLI